MQSADNLISENLRVDLDSDEPKQGGLVCTFTYAIAREGINRMILSTTKNLEPVRLNPLNTVVHQVPTRRLSFCLWSFCLASSLLLLIMHIKVVYFRWLRTKLLFKVGRPCPLERSGAMHSVPWKFLLQGWIGNQAAVWATHKTVTPRPGNVTASHF